jgi:hypothetical protein
MVTYIMLLWRKHLICCESKHKVVRPLSTSLTIKLR